MTRLTALALIAVIGTGAFAADPPTDPRADLREVEAVLARLEERVRMTAAKLRPSALQLAGSRGRCEAMLAEVEDRHAAAARELDRLTRHARALGAVDGIDPATVAAAEAAARQVQSRLAALADARDRLKERLAQLERDFVNLVLKESLPPPAGDDPVLAEVGRLLAPPAPAAVATPVPFPVPPVARPVVLPRCPQPR